MIISKGSLNYVFSLIPFFAIFYLESISIGGFSVGFLWKSVFLLVLAVFILLKLNKNPSIHRIHVIAYLIAFNSLIYYSNEDDWLINLNENVKYFSLPILMHLFHLRHVSHRENLSEVVTLCVMLAVFCVPFIFGWWEPLGKGYNLDLFGLEESGFVGFFQGPHSAGITMALCGIILLYQVPEFSKSHKLVLFFGLSISLVAVYLSYVRTAWLMSLVPLGLWVFVRPSVRSLAQKLLVTAGLSVFLYLFYQSSELLQMRFSGTNVYSSQDASFATVSSGRTLFWLFSIIDWFESGPLSLLIGSGYNHALMDMEARIGTPLIAHNGFIDALHMNGLIGFSLLLLFFKELATLLGDNRRYYNYGMMRSFFVAYFLYVLLQGSQFFLVDVLLAYMIALCLSDKVNKHQLT